MSNTRGHISEIHILRAIGCLFVVAVHVSGSFYYEHGETYNEFTLFINQISRFGTPMFALISGFLLFYQARFKGFDFYRFAASRFTKIGLPFLFWSVFYLLFTYLVLGVNPLESGEKQFLVNFIFGNAYYHLYFMSIVFQFYLLFPMLQAVKSKMIWPALLIGAVCINYYFVKSFNPGEFEGILGSILSQRAFLPSWIFYFIFGGFLAYFWEPLRVFSKKYKILLGIAVLIVTAAAVWEYKTMGSTPSNRVTNMFNIPIITLFVIGIGEQIQKIRLINSFITQIGTFSMAIYLVHPFVLYSFIQIAPDFVWKTAFFPFVYTLILLGSIAMVKAIQLIPMNQYILTVPGIKKQKSNTSVKTSALRVKSNFQ